MKILVIAESINVEDSSGSKVNVALIHNLKKIGYELRVLHYSHRVIDLPEIDCVLIKERKFTVLYFLSRAVRVFQRYTNIYINRDVEKIFGFSFTHTNDTISIKKGIQKHLDFNPDFVFSLSKGGSFRPHRALLKLPILHDKWIANIHDPYPFHLYPRPYNWVEKGYSIKENFIRSITEKARHVAFPSLLLKNWMESYFPAISEKSIIIPHQVNVEKSKGTTPDFFTENQFSLLHAGNLLFHRTPKFLLEAYLRFLKNNPTAHTNSKLYLVGNNEYHKVTLEPYQNHPNIVIKDYIDYKTVQSLEKKTAVNIILEAISEISPFLPGKFPNCVIANKPILILGPYYSEVRRLLGNEYPYWAEVNDIERMVSIIELLYKLWNERPNEMNLNRNDLVEYSNENGLKKILENLK